MIRLAVAVCALLVSLPLVARGSETSKPIDVDAVPSALTSLSYRAIGPAISGGRVTAVVGSDRDPAVYYAGGAGGGVFKSADGGVSWVPIFDREKVAPIGALAVSARDPDDVWAGTGEANPRNTVEEGAGMWHSRDGGKTWAHAGLDDAGSISSISVDPRDPRTLAVGVLGHVFRDGTTRGVYVTHDAGAHWTRALYLGPSSGASDVERVPGRPSTLFAGMWQFRRQTWTMSSGGPHGGLYRSDDNGTTWRKLSGRGLPQGLTGRIGIAPARGGRVYAIIQSRAGDVWRSDDGGGTWGAMPHDPFIGARPFYFSRLFVDPTNPDRVMNVSLILSQSTNGARSFKAIATNVGWDYHTAWFSADGRRTIVSSDEGVVLTGDRGRHWTQPYALPFAQPYHVSLAGAVPSYTVCIGLQNDGSWCGPSSTDNGTGLLNRDWYGVGPGDGMWALTDPTDPNLIWTTSTNASTGQVYIFDARTKQTREVSPQAKPSDGAARMPYRFNWDTPLAFSPDGGALVGGNVVFRTTDRGVHWSVISPDLTRNVKAHQQVPGGPISEDVSGAENADTILQIVPSQTEAGLIWVGTDDGLVQITRDNGTTWKNVTPPAMPQWGRVYTIEPGHGSAATAYIAVDAHMTGDEHPHVFVTDDYGATWRALAGNLPPSVFVRSVREDASNANLLYAGTSRGVYVSFDRGRRWSSLRLNMPATAIYDLQLHPEANDLVVASHGRGVWILDDLRPLQDYAKARPAGFTLFAPREAYRMWRYAPINTFQDGSLPAGDFIGDNRPYGAVLTYYLPKAARAVTIDVLDAQRHVVRHITGKRIAHKAGMNRASWDLAETGPARWLGTYEQNRGPETGVEVVPGSYTIRVRADGISREQPVTVKADPRDTATADDTEKRHAYLAELNAELGKLNTMLNAIDKRLKHASPAQAVTLNAMKHRITLDPRNIEDLKTPPRLREHLLDLLSRVASTGFFTPTAVQEAEAAALRSQTQTLAAKYAAMR